MENKNINILIAEDDFLVGDEIKRLLISKEYNIVGSAKNGLEAVEMCCSLNPDIILMDLKMPKLNGLDATKKIQELNPTPIIILTAHESKELIYKASKFGASAFLVKPPKINEIERSIMIALERHSDFENIKNLNSLLKKEVNLRIASEEALKVSEKEYRDMIENSNEPIIITQKDKIVFANNAYTKLLNYNEIVLDKFDKLKIPDNLINKNLINYETTIKNNDEKVIDIECSVRVILFKSILSKFILIRDISKQNKIINKLTKAAKQTEALKGVIPICAACHKIREEDNDNTSWINPEQYISKRLPDIQFTHTMCPVCMKEWYPNFVDKIESKQNK